MTPSIFRAPISRSSTAGVHLSLALVYIVIFAARYGYSPLIVPLHMVQVALGCVAAALMLRGLVGAPGQLAPGLARPLVATLGTMLSSAYLLVLIACAVTNEAWGWSVSVALAREYISSLPAIFGNLPFARGWLMVGGALFIAAEAAIIAWWWVASTAFVLRSGQTAGRSVSTASTLRASALQPVLLVLAAAAFVSIVRLLPVAAPEPFTALLTPPGLSNPDRARGLNRLARQSYARPVAFNRRNVIIIFSDALRADHTSVYGYRRHTTPFLERLAASGKLRQVTLALSTCSFTACGVLSTLASRDTRVLEPGSLKIHDVLHDLGYRVNIIASTDNSSWYTLRLHYGETVDYFFDAFDSRHFAINDDRAVLEGLDAVPPAGGPAFFLFFLSSSASIGAKHPEFRTWLPANVELGAAGVSALMNAYDNGILEADHSIEQIFNRLDAKGYLKNSLVVILGDHGEGFGEHGHFAHTKYLYQEVLHIPLLIYDDSAARYRNLEFATQSDIAPTLLDRLGLPVPSGWEGHSLFSEDPKTFSTHWTDRGRPWHAVVYRTRSGVYKYLCQTRWGTLVEELYELTGDPGEHRNLVSAPNAPMDVLAVVRRKAADTFGMTTRDSALASLKNALSSSP